MPPVPKKKHTRSRSNIRKNAPTNKDALPVLVKCESCGELKEPHKACSSCGTYKDKTYK